jgi:MoaA/NifB/PqqE/SkfB family radical SAM enzyme
MTHPLREILTVRRNLVAADPRPLSVVASVTGACNLRCAFCERADAHGAQQLSWEQIRRVADFAREWDCPLFLGGGEPMCHGRIWDLLELLASRGQRASMATNAFVLAGLDDARMDLLNRSIAMLSVSLDSADPAEHDRLRGRSGSFEAATALLCDRRRRFRSRIAAILQPRMDPAAALIELAAGFGVGVNFQPLIFASNDPARPARADKTALRERLAAAPPSRERTARRLAELDRLARRRHVATNLPMLRRFVPAYFHAAAEPTSRPFFEETLEAFFCLIPLVQVTVTEAGRLAPCSLLPGGEATVDGQIYPAWREQALEHRRAWRSGRRYSACPSCSCHYAENCRDSILALPGRNFRHLPWLAAYVFRRWLRKEGGNR